MLFIDRIDRKITENSSINTQIPKLVIRSTSILQTIKRNHVRRRAYKKIKEISNCPKKDDLDLEREKKKEKGMICSAVICTWKIMYRFQITSKIPHILIHFRKSNCRPMNKKIVTVAMGQCGMVLSTCILYSIAYALGGLNTAGQQRKFSRETQK